MNAPAFTSPTAKNRTVAFVSSQPTAMACPAKSWLWLPAAGLFMAAGGMALLGYRMAHAPAGQKVPKAVAARSGEGVPITAGGTVVAMILADGTSNPASQTAGWQGSLSSMADLPLEQLRKKLAASEALTLCDKRSIADALIALGTEEALQAWGAALLRETDPAARQAMMEALDCLNGEAAVEMITQLVELSDAPEVFDGVARTLSRMANPETVKYLAEIHASATPGDARQERALTLLGTIANPTAVPGLIELAQQPDFGTEVTCQALVSLGKIGNPEALTALSGAFDSLAPEYFAQRQQVIGAITSITNPESRAMLEDLAVNSLQPLVADAAAQALKNLPAMSVAEAEAYATEIPPADELLANVPGNQ